MSTSNVVDEADKHQRDDMVVLQRVVLPRDADFDTIPLYVEAGQARPGPLEEKEDDKVALPTFDPSRQVHPDLVHSRRSLTVPSGQRFSFATYFNAFPAGYWRRWTSVESVRLRVQLDGTATVMVYRTSANGNQQRVTSTQTSSGTSAEFDLSLKQFGDGGWYWFDIVAGDDDVDLVSADWVAYVSDYEPGTMSVGITTFNRPDYCSDLVRTLSTEDEVLTRIDKIFVVDQGTEHVKEEAAYAEAAESLGSQLVLVEQANLGGSGGFSRSMYEATYTEDSKYVLLLDDDVLVEPEGMLRALTFADLCRTPTIVGGHMLNMYVRSMLHAFGETVNRFRFFWGSAPHTKQGHDFALEPLRATRWLHRRIDVDYNGWWMCLIPTDVIREIGMSLPIFIKWDDAEYSLRAQKSGVPTVSLPGAAVWHVPWTDKDDSIDWQAYHHARNRILVALLHSPYDRGGRIVLESMNLQIKHGLAMQYAAAELRLWALEDLLSGPEHLHRDLPTKLGEIRAYRKAQDDAKLETDPRAYPPVRRVKPPKRGKDPTEPKGAVGRYLAAVSGVAKQLRPVRETSRVNPEVKVPAMDSRWSLLSQFDSAIVSNADGTGAFWYKRDRKRFMDLMRRSADLHRELGVRWAELSQTYRDSVPEVTGPDAWSKTWGDSSER
jgi:galactofuranosylgalactofuranosylrhamnosyl-N-acetylglucosaminyl-diphospho-decaprenol beta-1,5/1,6-galactofuranosyltransferase